MKLVATSLRYTLADAMLDYADSADSAEVTDMYRQDAQAVVDAPVEGECIVLADVVFHTAQTALVQKLAEAEAGIEEAHRERRRQQAQYDRFTKIIKTLPGS